MAINLHIGPGAKQVSDFNSGEVSATVPARPLESTAVTPSMEPPKPEHPLMTPYKLRGIGPWTKE